MPDDKNFFAGLFDFSFQYQLTRRLVKLLYIIGILAGGITVVIVALFVGILVSRVLLELTLVILRISEGIDRATHPGN